MTTATLNRTNIFITILLSPFLILKHIFSILVGRWKTTLRLFLVVSFFSTILLFAYFIYQINAQISERYLSQKYALEYDKLVEENQKLEMNLIGVNSSNNAESLIEKLNFEKVDKISYIKVLSGKVVKK